MKKLSILCAFLITLIILCNIAINAFANVGSISTPLEVITSVHQKVHDSLYFSGGVTEPAVSDTASLDLLILVGANPLHTVFFATSDGTALSYIYEGPTYSSAGWALALSNHNRITPTASTGSLYYTSGITNVGTQINGVVHIAGGAGKTSVGGSGTHTTGEIVLAPNTNYLFRTTNVSGLSKRMTSDIEFYEATP